MARAAKKNFHDPDLKDFPQELRWREWMGRVEAAVFCAAEPVSREVLARLVGPDCKFDDLIEDIRAELKARPYELVFVAGGFQLRTRGKFADAIRASGVIKDGVEKFELTKTENLVVTAIACFQPATRKKLSRILARDVSRDILARLKRLDLIGAGPRAPEPGAPISWVTTPTFLSVFGLASLRELPDIDALEAAGFVEIDEVGAAPDGPEDDIDAMLGILREDDAEIDEDDDQAA